MFGDGDPELGFDAADEELRRQQERSDQESLARLKEEQENGEAGRRRVLKEVTPRVAPESFLTPQGKRRRRRNPSPVSAAVREEHSRHTPKLPTRPEDAQWANR